MSSKVFDGVKVADFSWVGVGPRVTEYLAEHGATVVRIESMSHPDTIRLASPYKDGKAGVNRSAFWGRHNTSKFSVSLNLNHLIINSLLPQNPEIMMY